MPLFDKYKRDKFYKKEIVNDTQENDFLSSGFSDFRLKRPHYFYTVKRVDLGRPDVLSQKLYGNITYWWILLKFNNIVDPFNELEEGDIIKVPDKMDIDDFINETRKS